MKLRSIVLAGLLGVTALTTTGCLEDSVDDIIDAFDIQAGSVVLFNDINATTYILVNGESRMVSQRSVFGSPYNVVTEDNHAINISYSGSSSMPAIQNNGTTYVYAATEDCTDGYVLDTVGAEKLRVMNLSGGIILSTDLNISRNGEKINLGDAANCDVTAVYTGPTDGNWAIRYKGVNIFGIDGGFSNTEEKVEIVIYDINSGTEAAGFARITDTSL